MKNTTSTKTYLYVIKTPQMDEKETLCYSIKFGFAKDFDDRLKNGYGAYFWNITVLHVYEGDFTLDDEYIIKQHLAKYALFKTEWFKYCQEVIDFFNKYDTSEKLKTKIDEIPFKKKSNRVYHNVDCFLLDYIIQSYYGELTGLFIIQEIRKQLHEELRIYSQKNQILYLKNKFSFDEEDYIKYLEGKNELENYEVKQEVEKFGNLRTTIERFRFLLDYSKRATKENFENFLELIPGKYKNYYEVVGPEIIKACGCDESKIKKKWQEKLSNSEVKDEVEAEIYKLFKVGQRYTKADIKKTLNSLYERLGYQKKAKATDLELYYIMKPILTPDKKAGFEIIGKR